MSIRDQRWHLGAMEEVLDSGGSIVARPESRNLNTNVVLANIYFQYEAYMSKSTGIG